MTKNLLVEEFTNIVIQINGKKRGLIKTKIDSYFEEVILSLNKEGKKY